MLPFTVQNIPFTDKQLKPPHIEKFPFSRKEKVAPICKIQESSKVFGMLC